MHSLIYSASPKHVMIILVKSPEAIMAKSQERKVGANKDCKHPRRRGILNLLKWQRCTFKTFLRAYLVSKLRKILCGIESHV